MHVFLKCSIKEAQIAESDIFGNVTYRKVSADQQLCTFCDAVIIQIFRKGDVCHFFEEAAQVSFTDGKMFGCAGMRNGGGYLYTGGNNEMYSYGEEVYEILKQQLKRRWALKPYLEEIFHEAHETGLPLIRSMYLEYPEDEECKTVEDQYMFGEKYLVAPVYAYGARKRNVYLPEGTWKNCNDETVTEGKKWISADAPLEYIPVFEKVN